MVNNLMTERKKGKRFTKEDFLSYKKDSQEQRKYFETYITKSISSQEKLQDVRYQNIVR